RFEATVQTPVAHMHRIRARVIHENQTTLDYGGRRAVEITLACEEGTSAQLEIVDVHDASHAGNIITAEVERWFEVFFRVSANRTGRVRGRLVHAAGATAFAPYSFAERFA